MRHKKNFNPEDLEFKFVLFNYESLVELLNCSKKDKQLFEIEN